MAGVVRYLNVVSDNARWEGFELRGGDIVVSTPPKCGTTWTQALCAFLIHGTELPAPLSKLSPWLDMLTNDRDEIVGRLAAQGHRRVIKTHTPLDGLPFDERVTYVCVGRDPRDVHVSWEHHTENTDLDALLTARVNAVGMADLEGIGLPTPPSEDPRERFLQYVDEPASFFSMARLESMLHHLDTFWQRRDEPQLALFHYADLQRDLLAETRRLAGVLGIDKTDDELAAITQAASFGEMKDKAETFVPDVANKIWLDNTGFFHTGASGQWADLIDDDAAARYDTRVRELVEPDLARWAHGGWAAV